MTKHHDRDGLILRLEGGARSWIWRGVVEGRRREIGLDPAVASEAGRRGKGVTLAEARKLARRRRDAAENGDDPKAVRVQARRSGVPTFGAISEAVIAIREPGWKDGGRSVQRWRASLRDHAGSLLGVPVNRITAAAVLEVLIPLWHAKPETANRVRVRISTVLRFALAQGHREDDPTEAIKAALPKNGNGEKVHHAAVAHADVADVLRAV
ncbi:MAG: Arm DNA-binding domain-containing protein [Spirochaetaceae bacterium]|nr:Arm DNA-binding domain-containing protein [Spirochaetaceae bacterium]